MKTKLGKSLEIVAEAMEKMTPEQVKALGTFSLGMFTALGDMPVVGEMLMGMMSGYKSALAAEFPEFHETYESAMFVYRDHLGDKIRQMDAADKVREVMARESN